MTTKLRKATPMRNKMKAWRRPDAGFIAQLGSVRKYKDAGKGWVAKPVPHPLTRALLARAEVQA